MTARTQKIRIAVAVGPDGGWHAYGETGASEDDMRTDALKFMPEESKKGAVIYFITAEVPVPQPVEIKGRVE